MPPIKDISNSNQGFIYQNRLIKTPEGDIEIGIITHQMLTDHGFIHAFTTRLNGVSPLPSRALNLEFKNDQRANVEENRRRLFGAMGISSVPIVTNTQLHSGVCLTVDKNHLWVEEEQMGDALTTRDSGFLIGIKTADCLPILIADPETRVIAAVHAGWRSTLKRIAEKTVGQMQEIFGVNPANLLVMLGPCACSKCYEVGPELYDLYRKEFKSTEGFFSEREGKLYFSMQEANLVQFLSQGLGPSNIFLAPYCTYHQNDLFFSHRKEAKGSKADGACQVGRQLAVIGLL